MPLLTTLLPRLYRFRSRTIHTPPVSPPEPPKPIVLGHPFKLLFHTLEALSIAYILNTYILSINLCEGPSMLPTLPTKGSALATNNLHRLGRGIRPGDLVSYDVPTKEETVAVKRVLGMPGDFVLMGNPTEAENRRMIQVPKGHVWVCGDNLPASSDSRSYGPVPMGLIRGKVIAQCWPVQEVKWIRNPLPE